MLAGKAFIVVAGECIEGGRVEWRGMMLDIILRRACKKNGQLCA